MSLLCDAYDFLGFNKKKDKLLATIVDSVARSPLRSGAWQRLSVMRMDRNDVEGAWQALGRMLNLISPSLYWAMQTAVCHRLPLRP